jgi:hypothetical protein
MDQAHKGIPTNPITPNDRAKHTNHTYPANTNDPTMTLLTVLTLLTPLTVLTLP